jgi:hypothetical protein
MKIDRGDRDKLITHHRDNIDKKRRSVDEARIATPQPCIERNPLHRAVTAAERDKAHHAAHRMTMRIATNVARLAMIKTNRRISRCNVVIDDEAVEESFAMRPLGMA